MRCDFGKPRTKYYGHHDNTTIGKLKKKGLELKVSKLKIDNALVTIKNDGVIPVKTKIQRKS